MGQADKVWTSPMRPLIQITQGSVIVSTTHAKSVAFIVKSDKWHQDDIKRPGGDDSFSSNVRFIDAVLVRDQSVAGSVR